MGLTAQTTERLTSWTRTLNVEDALALVDSAQPGMTVGVWEDVAHGILPQASLARRRELVRIVRDELLDVHIGTIRSSAWLRLFHEGSPHRRTGLLLGRLWRNRPLVHRALDELVRPALDVTDRPLAPHDADLIEGSTWDSFLRRTLHADVPQVAFTKTRSTLQAALRDTGVLLVAGNTRRTTRVTRGRPDALAFSWTLAVDLWERGGEATEQWACRESFAGRLFAPKLDYATSCIEAGITAGLLRKGHLMGVARYHAGPEMR